MKSFGRILKSDRRSINDKPNQAHNHYNKNIHNYKIHDDPDNVDFDYRRGRRRKNYGGDNDTGTVVHVRKRNVHSHRHGHHHLSGTAEETARGETKKSTDVLRDSNSPVSGKMLAREAGKDNGVITDVFERNLIKTQNQSKGNGLTREDISNALQDTPHTSAPMKYSSMKEVEAGVNPELDKTLGVQKLMDSFRSYLPKFKGGALDDEIINNAESILARAPNGNIDAPFIDVNGQVTGRSYGDEAKLFVKKATSLVGGAFSGLMDAGFTKNQAEEKLDLSDVTTSDYELNKTCRPLAEINAQIENLMLKSLSLPLLKAENEYKNLIKNGVSPINAANMAKKIEKSVENEIKEKLKLAHTLKENAKECFVADNHRKLQLEIEEEKVNDRDNMIRIMNEEVIKEGLFPNLHPIHLNENELGYLRQLGNKLKPSEIGRRMFDAYAKSVKSGETEEDALNVASRTGYLLSEFNNELRKGVSPEIAINLIKERGNIKDAVDQRRSFVQNNGPEIAQLVAENTQLVQEAAFKISKNPESKDEVLEKLDNEMRNLSIKHANFIHEKSNVEDIHRPRKAADYMIDKTKFLNDQLINIAKESPIVAKDIIKKGMDNAREAASIFDKTLMHVNAEEKRHSPIPKSALRLLDEARKEQQLDQIARKNAEEEKNQRDALLKEHKDAEVMATEEKLARDNKFRKINEQGIKAAENVLRLGGTIEEARTAKILAEKDFAAQLENKEAMLRQDVIRSLSNGVDSSKAKKIAAHVAVAHSGDNAIGKTSEEVLKNEFEDRKRQALKKALYSDFSNEKVDVVKVISTDASEVNINNSVIKFPLNTFVDETPKDKGEEYVKNRADVLRNLVRNTVTRNKVNSGLNTIQTKDGFMNVGENSKKVKVYNGLAFIKPSGKIQMEKEGIDTSNWKSRHNQGERSDISNGELYYVAEVTDADLQLPSPINKSPGKFMSNSDEQLDANYIDELHIKKGILNQVPWNEFSDLVKPRLNLYPNEEEKIKEANMLKNAMAEEKKKEKLDSIKIYSFTNPNGDKHITTVPQYGIPETFEEKEGMKRLSNINPNKNVAISETPTESQKDPIINPLENIPDDQVLNSFVENTIAEGRAKNKAARFVGSTNGFTNEESKNKSDLLQVERFDISKHYINDGSIASEVKNELISKTKSFSKFLKMEKEDYINMIKKIPDSTIYQMDKYNTGPEKNPSELLDTDFSKYISNISQNIQTSKLINLLFNTISKITGTPNLATSVVLEKNIIPNLKAIERTETYKKPNGVIQYNTLNPPKPGMTVLSSNTTNGPLNISTGSNTSFIFPNPVKPPIKQWDNIVINPGGNPLTSGKVPFSKTTSSLTKIPTSPAKAIKLSMPGVQNKQRLPVNTQGEKKPSPVATPRLGGSVAGGARLGIASSPQK